MNLHAWIEARLAALPEDAFDSTDDWPENAEPFDAGLPGNFAAPLEPVTVTLEYRDANGEISERMVTLLQMSGTGEGPLFLTGRCHMRKARRTFRIDRILSVSGLPDLPPRAGPAELLHGLADLSLGAVPKPAPAGETAPKAGKAPKRPSPAAAKRAPNPAPQPAPAPRPAPVAGPARTPFQQVRFRFRAELRLVTFLAKSDGELHPSEQAAIDRYARALAGGAGLAWNEADSAALAAYCRNLAFSAEAERASLSGLQLADPGLAALFSAAVPDVMEADGRYDPAEILMVSSWGLKPEITSVAVPGAAGPPEAAPAPDVVPAGQRPGVLPGLFGGVVIAALVIIAALLLT